jgi:hypothetical protein
MGLKIIMEFLSSKDGDELFEKATEMLARFGITTTDSDGNVRNLYDVLCDVAEVLNKEK